MRKANRHDGPCLELQLDTDPRLPKTHGKRIRAIGGDYRAARGETWRRYVFVPCTRTGLALAAELVARYGTTKRDPKDPNRERRINTTAVLLRWDRLPRRHQFGAVDVPSVTGTVDLRAWVAAQGRRAAAEKARLKAEERVEAKRRIERRRADDAAMLNGASLEAGERMAAEFLFGLEG